MPSEDRPGQRVSPVGQWDQWYRDLSADTPLLYGDPTTYLMAAAFFADIDNIEDWGCGRGGYRRFNVSSKYVGIDGSRTPFADVTVDLRSYRSDAHGIMMRHVLEHNHGWSDILAGAVRSFRRKLCLILFTPFASQTAMIGDNREIGVDAPTLSFARRDLERHFTGLQWKLIPDIPTRTQYGLEHVYLVWRG